MHELKTSTSLSRCLVVAEKRSTLGIGLSLASAPADLLTGPSRYGDDHSEDEQHRHDGEGKDPLEGNDTIEELGDSQGSRQNAQVEAHGVVLVDDNEEHSVDQDRPDEDVGKDASNKAVLGRDHNGTVPVQGNEGPGEGTGDGGHVDALGVGIMAEVQRSEVDEVDD